MSRRRSRIEDLLHEGESAQETVEFGPAEVVVTSHRVLARTPEMSGANLRQADRPNVVGVDTGALSNEALLTGGVKYALVGGVLVVAGFVLDFDGLAGDVALDPATGEQVGMGGLFRTAGRLFALLARLDELLLWAGALVLLASVLALAVFWYRRVPTVVVRVAGEADIHLPRPGDAGEAIERLERALRDGPESPPVDTGGSGEPDDPL